MIDKGLKRGPQHLELFFSVCEKTQISIARQPSQNGVDFGARDKQHFVVILVEDLNKPVMNAIRHAKLLGGETSAIHVQVDMSDEGGIEKQWKNLGIDIPLVVLDSTDGSIIKPLTTFVNTLRQRHKESTVTFLLSVLVGLKWWHRFLHNQTAYHIEKVFQGQEGIATIRVPFSLIDDVNGKGTRTERNRPMI